MFLWRHGIGGGRGGDFSLLVSQGDVKRYISNGGSETQSQQGFQRVDNAYHFLVYYVYNEKDN